MSEGLPVVVEASYPAPPAAVWEAITDPARMRRWFFSGMAEFRAEVGFETAFDVDCEGTCYRHEWAVVAVERERLIAYRWAYGGIPGESTVTWSLAPRGAGTRLRLEHAGTESFPQNAVFSAEATRAGWAYFLNGTLKAYLEGRQGDGG